MAGVNVLIGLVFSIPFFKSLVPPKPAAVVTTVRIGCGSGSTGTQLDGNAPNVALFTDQGLRTGAPVKGDGRITQGSTTDVQLKHYSEMGNAASQYVAISAGGNDAICINYIALTWPDGDSAFISGDMGRACNRDWYYSRTVVGDASNNYIPGCMWIDGDHSGGLHYQGFSVHIPDFPQDEAREQEYQDHNELMCGTTPENARFGSWGKLALSDWPPMFSPMLPAISGESVDPPATYDQIRDKGVQIGPGPYGIGNGESLRRRDGKFRRKAEASSNTNSTALQEPVFMSGVLISSDHEAHSAHELCASDSSKGADFVSMVEQIFCDMETKEVWPLCSKEIVHGCFDLENQEMSAPVNSRRDATTGRTIPSKSYDHYHHWSKSG